MKLRPYQEEAVRFLKANPAAGLFIDMGLGKTASTLHALVDLPKPILIVGPIRVIETVWRQEAAKWPYTAGLTFSLVRGAPRARSEALKAQADIYLVNPELLAEVLDNGKGFKTLVIDESSMFKNPSTKRFKQLRKHLRDFERRVILTGTPTPNSLMDIWSQIMILDLGHRLDTSFFRFRARFFDQLDYLGYKWGPKEGAEDRILAMTSPLIFRVEAKGNLPAREVIHNRIEITLPPAARKLYHDLEKHALAVLAEDTISAATAAAALMKLRQVASGFVYDDAGGTQAIHSEKIQALQSVIEETGSPVIVVYHFQHELAALQKAFPQGKRFTAEVADDWDKGRIPVLFLHPQSGGHGLNLQYGGHTMAIFSGSFSYEQMAQTMARIDRQGQENPVVFHSLVATDTVDELVVQVLQDKESNQKRVLEQIKEYARAKTSDR